MSLIDIKYPKKRDTIVADYLATVKRICSTQWWNQLKNQQKLSAEAKEEEETRNCRGVSIECSRDGCTGVSRRKLKMKHRVIVGRI